MGIPVIVDSSLLLAILFAEPTAPWAEAQLTVNAGRLAMSTVNLTEVLIRVRDRRPQDLAQLESQLLNSGIRFVAPDVEQALLAAEARMKFPLNLGDCFAYALAKTSNLDLLTLDSDFRGVDVPLVLP